MPKKNVALYFGPVPVAPPSGEMVAPEKPPQYDSQGTTVDKQGTLYCSHVVATGMVVSGAELTRMRSTPELISSWVTCTATLPNDWVSFSVISMRYFVLPMVMPL